MLKKVASTKKVEVQAKVEIKKVRSLLNLSLNLDLSLYQKLRLCWMAFLSILRGYPPYFPSRKAH
jgi:hypothetical protein